MKGVKLKREAEEAGEVSLFFLFLFKVVEWFAGGLS